MRWLLTMLAVASGAWYVSNRQRRDRLQHSVRAAVPPRASERAQRVATTVAAAARQTAATLQTRVSGLAGRAPSVPDSGDGPTMGRAQPPLPEHTDALQRTHGAYIGNTRTRLFHRADSDHLPAEKHRVSFASEAEARAAAFAPAQNEGLETTDTYGGAARSAPPT